MVGMVDGHLDVGLPLKCSQPGRLAWPHDQVGDQDVVDPAGGHDLGLGDLGHRHPDRTRPAQQVGDRRALERLGMGTPRHASRAEVAGHAVDVLLERLEIDQESRRIQLIHGKADRAELHGGRSLASDRVAGLEASRHTCDGISNRLLYSRESSESASASWNDSCSASKCELLAGAKRDVAQVAQPGAQVADFDVGVGLLTRLLTQSRKFWTCCRWPSALALPVAPSPCSTRQPLSSMISVPLSP